MTGGDGEGPRSDSFSDALSDDDKNVLRHWHDSLGVLDSRYGEKGVLQLAHQAMLDEQFRSRLVGDTEALLGELQSKLDPLPEGVKLRFFANTPDTLNVVLPPEAGEMEKRPVELRERLSSRTSEAVALFRDDFDIGDFTDSVIFGSGNLGNPRRD